MKNYFITRYYYLSVVGAFFLSACSAPTSIQQQNNIIIPLNTQLFATTNNTIMDHSLFNEKNILALTKDQQKIFLEKYNDEIENGVKPHEAIGNILANQMVGFTYYGETYNAETTMRLNQGNCMSLAILTSAYAKLVGLKVSYRAVNTIPIFEQQGNLILSSSHVQTIIYDPEFIAEKNTVYLFEPSVVIDYFPNASNIAGKRFGKAQFLSMFYRNLSSNALIENELTLAFMLANKAYELFPSSVATVNLLAIIHRRAGDEVNAEKIYQQGLYSGAKNVTLLSNYIILLKSQQRKGDALKLEDELAMLDDPNPYHWLEQAYAAEGESN